MPHGFENNFQNPEMFKIFSFTRKCFANYFQQYNKFIMLSNKYTRCKKAKLLSYNAMPFLNASCRSKLRMNSCEYTYYMYVDIIMI